MGTPAKARSTVKIWKFQEAAVSPTPAMDQRVVLLRTLSPITSGNGVSYWNLQQDAPLGRVSYFPPLGEGEILTLPWSAVVLLQAEPMKCTILGMEQELLKVGRRQELGLAYPTPCPSPHS